MRRPPRRAAVSTSSACSGLEGKDIPMKTSNWHRSVWLAGFAALSLTLVGVQSPATVTASARVDDVTVSGCLERDAASATVYLLIAAEPPERRMYHVRPAAGVDLAPHVGKVVEIVGTLEPAR